MLLRYLRKAPPPPRCHPERANSPGLNVRALAGHGVGNHLLKDRLIGVHWVFTSLPATWIHCRTTSKPERFHLSRSPDRLLDGELLLTGEPTPQRFTLHGHPLLPVLIPRKRRCRRRLSAHHAVGVHHLQEVVTRVRQLPISGPLSPREERPVVGRLFVLEPEREGVGRVHCERLVLLEIA